MRSYVYAALKLSVAEYEGDAEKFTSIMKDIVIYGSQDRLDGAQFVAEVAAATGQPTATVERWVIGASVPHQTIRKIYLQSAFDQILAGRP